MKTYSLAIDSAHAGPAPARRFNKTHTALLYIIYLLTLLIPLTEAGASPEADFAIAMAKASAGDAASQQKVGQAYYEGKGVQQNHREAFAWLVKAAEQNNIQAQKDVAYLYSNGHGVSQDEAAAFNWHMKAALLGDPMAMLVVATRYEMGIGVAADNVKSTDWLQRSALHGNNEAKSALGYAYLTGTGVAKDPKQAFALFLSSEEIAHSRFLIAYLYNHGVFVTQDMAKAYMWCLLATELEPSNPEYTQELAKLKAGLTAAQLTQATATAAEYKDFMANPNLQRRGLNLSYPNKEQKSARLPFRIESGTIIVAFQVAGHGEVDFMLDTGAQFSVLAQRTADKIKLKPNDYISVTGIGSKISLGEIAGEITLKTPELVIEKARLIVIEDLNFDELCGTPIGGILGMDLLGQAVLAINYIDKTVTLSAPDSFRAEPGFTKLPLVIDRNLTYIEAQVVNNQVNAGGHFLIDTGSNAGVTLTKHFQTIYPELNFKAMAASGASGVGGVMSSLETRSHRFQVGELSVSGPPVSLDQNPQGAHPNLIGGLLGAEVLSRFDLIIDAPHRSIYLKPNPKHSLPFPAITISGFGYKALRDDYKTVIVHTVIPGSPAEKAGIKTGDLIAKINGKSVDGMPFSETYATLHLPQTHLLVIKRGSELIDIKLEPIVIR